MRFFPALALAMTLSAAGPKVIVPVNGVPPVGPYSPALEIGGYVFVSGQGVRDSKSQMPDGIEAQTRQCIENVRAILDAAGLTLDSVVSVQLYVTDPANLPGVEKIYHAAFTKNPSRIALGVARMPTGTTVEITVTASRGGKPRSIANNRYAVGTAGPGIVPANALPGGASHAVFAIAAPPPPSVSAFCEVAASDPSGTVEQQTSNVFGKLKACLASKGMTLSNVVATNVYLDDIDDFAKMNGVYATFFPDVKPTRTTVQPVPPAHKGSLVRLSALAVR